MCAESRHIGRRELRQHCEFLGVAGGTSGGAGSGGALGIETAGSQRGMIARDASRNGGAAIGKYRDGIARTFVGHLGEAKLHRGPETLFFRRPGSGPSRDPSISKL
jgi:hypothetical protein